ncbi:MAG: hypothetical protein ACREOQ_04000 [Gemmatimonadales bacterium]
MAIHSRRARMLALVGALALGGASALTAQQPTNASKDTSAARSDTSGYQSYQNRADSTRTDSSGFKYTGPPTDTTLKAEPGAQTGPTAGDSGMGKMGSDSSSMGKMSGAGAADSVVCKDGSNAAGGGSACSAHGGVDSVATRAALKARGWTGKADSGSSGSDTSSSSHHQSP